MKNNSNPTPQPPHPPSSPFSSESKNVALGVLMLMMFGEESDYRRAVGIRVEIIGFWFGGFFSDAQRQGYPTKFIGSLSHFTGVYTSQMVFGFFSINSMIRVFVTLLHPAVKNCS